jgi:hypothetical protein
MLQYILDMALQDEKYIRHDNESGKSVHVCEIDRNKGQIKVIYSNKGHAY